MTRTLVYKERSDEAFMFIDKLVRELLADLIGRSRFRTFEKRDKWQFFFCMKEGSKLIWGVFDPGDFIF